MKCWVRSCYVECDRDCVERRQLERLKHDFTYNLQLLKERDAELEQYDVNIVALRTELDQRDARAREAKRVAEEASIRLGIADKRVAALEAASSEAEAQKVETDANGDVEMADASSPAAAPAAAAPAAAATAGDAEIAGWPSPATQSDSWGQNAGSVRPRRAGSRTAAR